MFPSLPRVRVWRCEVSLMKAGRQFSRRLAGALLIVAVIGCAAGTFMLDELVETMRGRTDVIAVLGDAVGVRRGTPVRIAGKPAGRVKRIAFLRRRADRPPRLAVTLEVVGPDVDHVRASSTVRVTSDGLVGGAVIDIIPAPTTSPPLSENDTLYGRGGGAGSADAVKHGAASLKASLDSLAGAAAMLAAPARRFALRADHIERNLGAVQAEMTALQSLLHSDSGALLDSAFLARLDRMMATARDLAVAFREARSRYAGASTELVEPIARIQRRADTLSTRITAIRSLLDVPAAPGVPGRLRADSAVFVAIRGVKAQLDSLIAEVRRDPFGFGF